MLKRVILIGFFIFLIPLTLFITKFDFNKKTMPFRVPSRIEQPKDTEIIQGAFPLHHWKTSNAVDTYFVPTEQLPIVDLHITFDAGSARDANTPGLAALCSYLLEEGAGSLSADQIAEQFENVGAEFNTRVTRDKMTIKLRALADPHILMPVVTLVSQLIAFPSFNESSVEQLKNQVLITLKQSSENPETLGSKALDELLYPKHPYGHLISGTMEGISKIKPEDLVAFHKRYFVTKNASITIVGGIHRDLARDISNLVLNTLETGEKPVPIPTVHSLTKLVEKRISIPSKQTHILLGSVFNVESEQDYYALLLANYILGDGPLVARLFKDLREKRGLTYNVGSDIEHFLAGDAFLIYAQTKAGQGIKTLAETLKVTNDFIEQGPTEVEIEEAKRGMIGGFPLTISNNAKIADMVSTLVFYKWPLDYINTYPQHIGALNKKIVQETVKKYIQTDKMAIVMVGEEKS